MKWRGLVLSLKNESRFASDKQKLKNRSLTMLEYYFHERIYGMEWKGMHVMAYILLRKEYE